LEEQLAIPAVDLDNGLGKTTVSEFGHYLRAFNVLKAVDQPAVNESESLWLDETVG
jgi:hypothetical protein